jgi:hypothetical protein
LDFSGENFVCNEVFASECFFGSYFWFAWPRNSIVIKRWLLFSFCCKSSM